MIQAYEAPYLKIKWKRGKDKIDFKRARITLVLGKKGGGKSAFLENCALRHDKIIDLLGSRDDEALAWLRESAPKRKALLIHGDNTEIKCKWDTCKVSAFTYEHIQKYDLIINCDSFYSSQKLKFEGINQIIDQFWYRRSYDPTRPIAVIMRELSDFIYSRIVQQGLNIKEAKADFIVFQRQLRHFGYSPYMDTIRWTSVDKEIRDLADYLVFKKVGSQGLPRDIQFLYKHINPLKLANLSPDKFMILTESASIGIGGFGLPVFHKQEGIDLIKELGIEISYTQEVETSTTQNVGDKEHVEIIKTYHSGKTVNETASIIQRSNFTVSIHVRSHDSEIDKLGGCSKCARAKSELYATKVSRNRKLDFT